MRVLLVHNDYGKPSGEEAVVAGMRRMLERCGHTVSELRMTSAGLRDTLSGKIRGFVQGIYSPSGRRAMRRKLTEFRPDVVNVHNLYPFISPAALFECRKAGVPVVMTVHNFRLMCPTGLFMRDDSPCLACLEHGNEWRCVRYNCEHSLLKSLGYAARNTAARTSGAYRKCVTAYACITDFQRQCLKRAGFDADRLRLIPNSVEIRDCFSPVPDSGYVAYCGRISREKGVDMIVDMARNHPDVPFRLAGEVRDKEIVDNLPDNVTLAGFLSGTDLENFYRDARMVVMASRWYEGFPMTILEAAQYGRPVVAPDHGGFSEIIGSGAEAIGILFRPGDAESLQQAVLQLWNDPQKLAELGVKARNKLITNYSTSVTAEQWNKLLNELHHAYGA